MFTKNYRCSLRNFEEFIIQINFLENKGHRLFDWKNLIEKIEFICDDLQVFFDGVVVDK